MTDSLVKSKLIHITSDERENYYGSTTSDFVINLGSYAELSACKRMILKSVTFPNVFYNVTNGNNILLWTDDTKGQNNTTTITPGFYNITQLMTAVQTDFNSKIGAGVVTVTMAQITSKVNVTSTLNNITIYGSDDQKTPSTLFQLGFVTTTSSGKNLNASNQANLIGLTEVFINSKALCHGNLIRSDKSVLNTIMKVNIDVPYQNQQVYESKESELDAITHRGGENIQSFDIQLTDRYGTPLDLDAKPLKLLFKVYFTSLIGQIDY